MVAGIKSDRATCHSVRQVKIYAAAAAAAAALLHVVDNNDVQCCDIREVLLLHGFRWCWLLSQLILALHIMLKQYYAYHQLHLYLFLCHSNLFLPSTATLKCCTVDWYDVLNP